MSEDAAAPYDQAENYLQFNDFIRYLDAVGMKQDCPQCGAVGQWGIFTETEAENPSVSVWRMVSAPVPNFRTFAAMWCTNCGSTRNVLIAPIKEWLSKESADGQPK